MEQNCWKGIMYKLPSVVRLAASPTRSLVNVGNAKPLNIIHDISSTKDLVYMSCHHTLYNKGTIVITSYSTNRHKFSPLRQKHSPPDQGLEMEDQPTTQLADCLEHLQLAPAVSLFNTPKRAPLLLAMCISLIDQSPTKLTLRKASTVAVQYITITKSDYILQVSSHFHNSFIRHYQSEQADFLFVEVTSQSALSA